MSIQKTPMCRSKTSSCVHSKTSSCVPAPRAHVETHVCVVRHTRGRFECAHGSIFSVSHHTTPHTHHTTHRKTQHNTTQKDTPQDTTTKRPQHHTETERQRKKTKEDKASISLSVMRFDVGEDPNPCGKRLLLTGWLSIGVDVN